MTADQKKFVALLCGMFGVPLLQLMLMNYVYGSSCNVLITIQNVMVLAMINFGLALIMKHVVVELILHGELDTTLEMK